VCIKSLHGWKKGGLLHRKKSISLRPIAKIRTVGTVGISGRAVVASFEQYMFTIQSVVTDTHIHTVAQLNTNHQSPITNHFYIEKNNYQNQHKTTHQYLLKNYAKMTNLATADLRIQKDENQIPYVYFQNKKQSTVISMSHHGHYGAYAMLTL